VVPLLGRLLSDFVEMENGMNKKWMALAVAATVSAPTLTLADNSNVTLYGTLNADIETVKAGDAISSRNRVSSNSSNIGFRGTEDLGGGLNAWFQVESNVHLDGGSSADTWSSRNSAVGLKGTFGSVLLGQWDSPYKYATLRLDPFGDTTIAAYSGIMGGGGSPTSGNIDPSFVNSASFDRRVRNAVQYWSPIWSGFSFRAAYGANEEKTTNSSASNNPSLWSLSGFYDNGPLYLLAAYEQHKDSGALEAELPIYFGPGSVLGGAAVATSGTPQGKDQAWKLGGAYTFLDAFTVAAVYEQLKYKSDLLGLDSKVKNYYLAGTYKTGPHALSLTYARRDKVELDGLGFSGDVPDSKADQYGVRYGYSLSKRTELYAMYTKLKNGSNSYQDFAVNPIGLDTTVAAAASNRGCDPQGIGAGLILKF
jgi:predicted porin